MQHHKLANIPVAILVSDKYSYDKNTSFLYSSLYLIRFSLPLAQMSFFLRFDTLPNTSFS